MYRIGLCDLERVCTLSSRGFLGGFLAWSGSLADRNRDVYTSCFSVSRAHRADSEEHGSPTRAVSDRHVAVRSRSADSQRFAEDDLLVLFSLTVTPGAIIDPDLTVEVCASSFRDLRS
jgi:hypothetical protein